MASRVTPLFSPKGGIEEHIVAILAGAKKTIEMAAYGFSNQTIADALLSAIQRGVSVTVVMDRSQTQGPQASIHDQLEKAGADVQLVSPPGGIMHDKFVIIDGAELEWGSYNYTERAENENFENATFASDAVLAGKYHADFEQIHRHAKPETSGVRRPIKRFFRLVVSRMNREK